MLNYRVSLIKNIIFWCLFNCPWMNHTINYRAITSGYFGHHDCCLLACRSCLEYNITSWWWWSIGLSAFSGTGRLYIQVVTMSYIEWNRTVVSNQRYENDLHNRLQSQTSDFAPCATTGRTGRNIRIVFDSAYPSVIWKNWKHGVIYKTGST